jgi:hypothetical protein
MVDIVETFAFCEAYADQGACEEPPEAGKYLATANASKEGRIQMEPGVSEMLEIRSPLIPKPKMPEK